MISYLDILMPIVAIILSYLIGSIPISVLIGKACFKQDIREFGSKNPGGTNATRLWGKKIGFTIILLDMLKGLIPIWVSICVFRLTNLKDLMLNDSNSWAIWLSALGAVLGHCYSIFLRFKGGKGVATTVGVVASTNLCQFALGIATFFTTLKVKKMVGLSSMVMSCFGSLFAWILYILNEFGFQKFVNNSFVFNPFLLSMNLAYPIVITLITIVIIIRHKENIKRMINNNENTI